VNILESYELTYGEGVVCIL